ncbi:MAG TPA: ornithine cyclodeaminase family protein [Actinomycetota bacterium]|nr:ornithine cyclodeaminase family protein [Actinomycetota bacterium]
MSSDLRVIGAEEIRAALPMRAAIDALETAFRSGDPSGGPVRSSVDTPGGSLLLMPAFDDAAVGVKLVTITPENPRHARPLIHATYALFDGETQALRAILDGAELTALRTAAVSGLATRRLAREDASRLVIFGAGVQARSHLAAMVTERPVAEVVVVSRTAGPAEQLVREALERGMQASVGGPEAVAEADLICTCTTSEEPLFDGSTLRPGAHVNAVGTHLPTARELDTETISRARVVVESREVALAEAGELVIPLSEGAIGREHVVADLAEVAGGASVRTGDEDVTVFKSVGMAFEDLAVARAIVDAAS